MSDTGIFWLLIAITILTVSMVIVLFAVMSNSRNNVQTLEEANEQLVMLRKELKNCSDKKEVQTLEEPNELLMQMRKDYGYDQYDYERKH